MFTGIRLFVREWSIRRAPQYFTANAVRNGKARTRLHVNQGLGNIFKAFPAFAADAA